MSIRRTFLKTRVLPTFSLSRIPSASMALRYFEAVLRSQSPAPSRSPILQLTLENRRSIISFE